MCDGGRLGMHVLETGSTMETVVVCDAGGYGKWRRVVVCGRQSMKRLLALRQQLKAEGLEDLSLINVGGGLAIDYTRYVGLTLFVLSCLVLW